MRSAILLSLVIGVWAYSNATGDFRDRNLVYSEGSDVGYAYVDSSTGVELLYSDPYNIEEFHLTKSNGSIKYNGHRETWYSTNEPGQTVTATYIPGKHVASDGTIRDEDGYICVATDQDFYQYGDVVMTSVGPGKVYDCGCSYGTVDVYTSW